MASLIVVTWRDIPAQVIAKAGRKTAKRQLTERFEKAIDRAAMKAKLRDSDSYLGEWRRADPIPCDDDLETAAETEAQRLEAAFPDERLSRFVEAGGFDPDSTSSHSSESQTSGPEARLQEEA